MSSSKNSAAKINTDGTFTLVNYRNSLTTDKYSLEESVTMAKSNYPELAAGIDSDDLLSPFYFILAQKQ